MKIYTRSGDKGQTSLFDGSRVRKDDLRIDVLGELDELNARIGMLVSFIESSKNIDFKEVEFLQKIQSLVLDLGSEIANPKLEKIKFKDFSEYILEMENKMDEMDKNLEELKNFILPGGANSASQAHLCRTQARKAERKFLELQNFQETNIQNTNESINKFLNRLSDYFFMEARFLNKQEGKDDIIWKSL